MSPNPSLGAPSPPRRPPRHSQVHAQIQHHLDDLLMLAEIIRERGVLTEPLQTTARSAHLFFTTVGIAHHVDEERHLFPRLVQHGDAAMKATVQALEQDHLLLKNLWLQIAPGLDTLARGHRWRDVTAFVQTVEAFVKLYAGHMAVEDALNLADVLA